MIFWENVNIYIERAGAQVTWGEADDALCLQNCHHTSQNQIFTCHQALLSECSVVSDSPTVTSAAPEKAIFTTLRSATSLGKHKQE